MSDHDRGAYTPPSDRLAFDPREPVRSGPAPVTLILSALVLIGLVGGVAFIYRHGARHPGAAPAQVGTPVGDIKTAPPADANAAPARLSVQKVNANAMPNFAPPPEQPQTLPVVTPGPGAPQGVSSAAPPPPPPAAANSAVAAKAVKPLTIASLADAAMSKPAAKVATKPKAAVVAPPPAAPAAVAAAPGAGWVQIGAFSTPALAATGWSDIARLEPGPMAGKGKKVEAVSAGGKTLYRAYITGFTPTAAQGFCAKLRAAGKSCIVK
jgi:SPOR domain